MKCPNCGSELREGAKFCIECGAAVPHNEEVPAPPVPEVSQVNAAVEQQNESEASPAVEATAPLEEKPVAATETVPSGLLLTTAQYFFLMLLFHVPVVGLIFLFVWGCGRPRNLSLKRYSLAILTMRLIAYFLYLLATVFVLLAANGWIPGVALDLSFLGM